MSALSVYKDNRDILRKYINIINSNADIVVMNKADAAIILTLANMGVEQASINITLKLAEHRIKYLESRYPHGHKLFEEISIMMDNLRSEMFSNG